MDTRSAQLAFLYARQREALARVGRIPSPAIRADDVELWSRHVQGHGTVASPFEDPLYAKIIATRQWEVEDALEHLGRRVKARPVIGTLPYRTLNAHSIPVPNQDAAVILFDQELFDFLFVMAWVVSHALPETPDPSSTAVDRTAAREHAQVADEPFAFFREVMLGYLVRGKWGALQLPFEEQAAVRTTYLSRIAHAFVLSHEYAHLLPEEQRHQCRVAYPPETPPVFAESWRTEHAADELAMFASGVAHIRLGGSRDGMYLGPTLYFFAQTLLLYGLHVLNTGTRPQRLIHAVPAGSHPPPMNRLGYLTLRGRYGFGEEMTQYNVPIEAVVAALSALFHRLEPELLELHRSGVRPHVSWPVPAWMAEPNLS